MRKLGKYEVLGELGHGAMGVVYRARDPIINRMVALKTITTGLADNPSLLERFYREAQSAGGLQHPNIVTIYDMGEEQGTPYIAMELIEGESLEQMIARRANVPLALKLTYALQACRAFDYAHKRGIVHRDIKPGNVMVNKESVVKVVDFGIARVLDTSKTQTGMLIGTFTYMSPEQYHGEHADERSDIWSFGVLLFELLYYQRPFTGENPASLMHSICSEEPRFLRDRAPDCPEAMESIISRILRKSPQDRFQSMEDVLLELEPIYKELQAHSIEELIDQSRQLIEQGEFARARELLRELLKVDSANAQARALLEKVNVELKRLSIRPKAQQLVDKGRALLKEGRIQEARTEAENALHLDTSFEPAQELAKQIQHELDRAQMVAEWLQAAGQHLAEGMPDKAEELLAKVLEMEPANKQATDLEQQVLAEKAERQRRLRLAEKMQEARALWTQLNYDSCLAVLAELLKEFPGEEEVQRLMDTVREDQAEQHRQKTLEWARNFLAIGNYAESRGLLADLQKQFPNDEEIPRLLEDIRLDEAKQRRLQGMTEARTYLANRQYGESIALLSDLKKEFRDDREILQLLEAVRADQADQQRQQGISEARNLLAAKSYDQCAALVAKLQARFPADDEVRELQEAIRRARTEQRRQESLAKARNLLAARHYEESITLLNDLRKEFPADEEEVCKLLDGARAEQTEQQRQKSIAEVRNLLAARGYGGCNVLLTKLLKQFPNDSELLELQRTVRAEQAEQKRLLGIAEARDLLAARRYDECNALLTKLREQFPEDSEIGQIQKAVGESQAEQRKSETLAKARSLLASRNYEESLAILVRMGKEFPHDENIRRLLKTAQEDQADQQRQQGIVEARNLLAARRYDDCGALLTKLQKQFPNDAEIPKLQEVVREDKAEQEKLGSLAKARNLLAKREYEECTALLSELGRRFPKDEEIPRLVAAAQDGLAEQRKLKGLAAARTLLAARRYDEAVLLLTELKQEFADDREIPRLLANASKEQAEQQKQQKLAEARALLAAQRFDEALQLLDTLRVAYPKDNAVEKLRALVERERDKQSRSERLQRELEALKELVSEKRYSELLARAEPLKVDFPTNGDLLRLIDFARGQQARIDSEHRLRTAIDNVKASLSGNQFTDAIRLAEAGLRAFPENAELVHLREQAEAQEKKQRARGMIEQRIREIKFKINRADLSEAIELAKQTIATAGPDTDLTHLLNSATIELQAREKKRRQEQKLDEIRTLVESGNVDGAAQTLQDAVETEVLDALDPRVSRVSQEIDTAKSPPTILSPAVPSVPADFSKEYAFLQRGPLSVEPPPTDNVGATATSVPQASTAEPSLSSPSTVPMPPPQLVAVPPPEPSVAISTPAPAPVAPDTPKRSFEPTPVQKQAATIVRQTAPIARPRDFKKAATLGAIGIGLVLSAWAAVHLLSHKNEEPTVRSANANRPTTAVAPAKPAVNPVETEQRDAMALSDKLIASGDLKGALESLQGADKLNGPLTAEIKKREAAVSESMRNDSLAKQRQQEAVLWQQATSEVDKGEFDAAIRDFRKIQASGDSSFRRTDAQRYLDDVIPKRRNEERIFRQAQQSAKANDQQGLQRASNLLDQVIALDGPRKPAAQELQRNVVAKLASLKQEATNREIVSLEAAARVSIQQGDLNSARQNAGQISQIGGDPTALIREIDEAQARQARTTQQAREFQQAVQSYNAIDSRDKSGLEKSRSDFAAIVKENGSQAAQAKQYVIDIDNKLAALNTQPVSPVTKTQSTNVAPDDRGAVRDVIERFIRAFENRNPDGVPLVWPTIPPKTYAGYKRSFEDASAIEMQLLDENIKIDPDGMTATVSAHIKQEYTPKGQKPLDRSDAWLFQLAKQNGSWAITDVR